MFVTKERTLQKKIASSHSLKLLPTLICEAKGILWGNFFHAYWAWENAHSATLIMWENALSASLKIVGTLSSLISVGIKYIPIDSFFKLISVGNVDDNLFLN